MTYYNMLYCTVLHHTIAYRTIPYYVVPYYIVLQHIWPSPGEPFFLTWLEKFRRREQGGRAFDAKQVSVFVDRIGLQHSRYRPGPRPLWPLNVKIGIGQSSVVSVCDVPGIGQGRRFSHLRYRSPYFWTLLSKRRAPYMFIMSHPPGNGHIYIYNIISLCII